MTLAVSKEQIKDAPNVDDDGRIDASEQDALYRHYALAPSAQQQTGHGPGAAGRRTGQRGHLRACSTHGAITRSQEQLRVGTETVEAGRARLRKYVVTENVSTTVPVSHEEVRVEREPITGANRDAALSGEPISEEEQRGDPAGRAAGGGEGGRAGRAALTMETVTEDAAVNETVRKEQIEEPGAEGSTRDAGR